MSDERSEVILTDGFEVVVSNPGKVLFCESGITKLDLCRYYQRISGWMLPHLTGRAVMMERFPDGIANEGFFQKEIPAYFPAWIGRAMLEKKNGFVTHPVIDTGAGLVYLASQACITVHTTLSLVREPRIPDRLVFDLDPSEGDFTMVRRAALGLREMLAARGLTGFCKTTGSRGLHVEVPLNGASGFKESRAFARDVSRRLMSRFPGCLTMAQRREQRKGRVFLDCFRNGYAQTVAAAYSVRARPGAPIAAPVAWREVEDAALRPDRYNMGNIFKTIGHMEDPWKDFSRSAVPLPV